MVLLMPLRPISSGKGCMLLDRSHVQVLSLWIVFTIWIAKKKSYGSLNMYAWAQRAQVWTFEPYSGLWIRKTWHCIKIHHSRNALDMSLKKLPPQLCQEWTVPFSSLGNMDLLTFLRMEFFSCYYHRFQFSLLLVHFFPGKNPFITLETICWSSMRICWIFFCLSSVLMCQVDEYSMVSFLPLDLRKESRYPFSLPLTGFWIIDDTPRSTGFIWWQPWKFFPS